MSKGRVVAALFLATSLFSLGGPASSHAISLGHHKSWGLAGVSLEQYATDSQECARAAAEMDLSGTAPAQALVVASRMFDTYWDPHYNPMLGIAGMYRTASPEIQWNRAATIMEKELEGCLITRGYIKFELTDDQYRRLKTYDAGTPERRQYLHSLASDPDVLAAQALTDT